MSTRARRAVLVGLSVLVLGLLGAFAAGRLTVLVTDGVSMEPLYSAGDLVVVAQASSYGPRDVVAYHDPDHDVVALHRIVGGGADGFVLRGDNNDSTDPYEPAAEEILGRSVLHVPGAGVWLDRLTHPAALAVYGFALVVSGGAAGTTRRTRRRRTMSQHAIDRPRSRVSLGTLPPALRTAAGVTGAAAVLAVGLGAFGWSGPLHQQAPDSAASADQEMTFSYSADVPLTPAYDGTTVTSPDTVFRALTDSVDVRYAYSGEPGSVSVVAELSTGSGWRSTVPLADPVAFEESEYEGEVRLDLPALEARASAAAEVTGLPAENLTVTVVPTVTTPDGDPFSRSLALTLSPLALAPAADATTLMTEGATAGDGARPQPRTLDLLGFALTADFARLLSVATGGLAALAAAALLVLAWSVAPRTESDAIRRRYASLLVPVQPMPAPAGRPVVDVTAFATLATIAERYGLLVLHWTRSGVETFVVQDEGITYRYRTGVGVSTDDPEEAVAPSDTLSAAPSA